MTKISSNIYKLSASAYMRVALMHYLRRRWWIGVLLLPFVILSFEDSRFLFVALMVVFLVLPMFIVFVYFNLSFSPECVASIRRCRVNLTSDSILYYYLDDENNITSSKCIVFEETDRIIIDKTNILIHLKTSKTFAFYLIPISAFDNAYEIEKWKMNLM